MDVNRYKESLILAKLHRKRANMPFEILRFSYKKELATLALARIFIYVS